MLELKKLNFELNLNIFLIQIPEGRRNLFGSKLIISDKLFTINKHLDRQYM